jgi:hypothetical protein
MSKQAGQTARRAAAVIEQRGWNQGGWVGIPIVPTGEPNPVCIRAAFNLATYGIVAMSPSPEEQEFARWMAELGVLPEVEDEDLNLADWNDDRARTKDEVLAYLNKFAEEHDPQPVLP